MLDSLVFEHLVTLNRSIESAIDTIKKLAEYPELQKEGFLASSSYFRESLSNANVSVLEALHQAEETAGGEAYKERRAYEKLIRDPDDCYLEVLAREKERVEQGLPPLIGIRYGAQHGVVEEPCTEAHDEVEQNDPERDTSEDGDDNRAERTSEERGELRRQKIVARIDAARTSQGMTKQEFHTRIGSSTFDGWKHFVDRHGDAAWEQVTPQLFEKIARVLGVNSVELLIS